MFVGVGVGVEELDGVGVGVSLIVGVGVGVVQTSKSIDVAGLAPTEWLNLTLLPLVKLSTF